MTAPGAGTDESKPTAGRGIGSRALGIGIAVAAYAISFGAVTVATGLSVLQTQALSALMFTGASQFAFVAVMAAGGGAAAAVFTATLLGLRNGLYGLHLARVLTPRGRPAERLRAGRRLGAAMFTIDETTAMAMAYEPEPEPVRRAFWSTGWSVFLLWNVGTLLGALGAAAVRDPRVFGLDAAIPAGFLALLWPRLVDRSAWALAVAAGTLALVMSPLLRPGLPVLAGAGIAVAAALWLTRERPGPPGIGAEGTGAEGLGERATSEAQDAGPA
jgi:predicted branched-subunit amino acid permease